MLALTADPEVSGSFNIASGNPHTILELATELWRARGGTGAQPEVTGEWRLGDVRHVQASPARAASVLGFEATTPFAQGIAATVPALELRDS
jgi:dTDP-L-rhamnose 4-epimerase